MPALSTIAGIAALAGGAGSVVSSITGNKAQKDLQRKADMERARSRQAQLNALSTMRKPEQSEATKRRIAALEQDAKATPLVEDPYFQADRATIVQGGQQALSGIQNTQRAMGTSGGFSNQGSMSDVYDRVGGQLAQLGQESRKLKDQKSQTAADMQQAFLDSQNEFENAQARARAAIEAGDGAAAQEAIRMAMDARQKQQQTEQQLFGSLTGGITSAFGSDWLGKSKDAAPQGVGQTGTAVPAPVATASRTWRSMRKG